MPIKTGGDNAAYRSNFGFRLTPSSGRRAAIAGGKGYRQEFRRAVLAQFTDKGTSACCGGASREESARFSLPTSGPRLPSTLPCSRSTSIGSTQKTRQPGQRRGCRRAIGRSVNDISNRFGRWYTSVWYLGRQNLSPGPEVVPCVATSTSLNSVPG